jgi:hypothetical protein
VYIALPFIYLCPLEDGADITSQELDHNKQLLLPDCNSTTPTSFSIRASNPFLSCKSEAVLRATSIPLFVRKTEQGAGEADSFAILID